MASRKQRKAKKHPQSKKNSNLAQDQVSYLFRHFPSLIRITNLFSIINSNFQLRWIKKMA